MLPEATARKDKAFRDSLVKLHCFLCALPCPSAHEFPSQHLQLRDTHLAVKQPVMRKQLALSFARVLVVSMATSASCFYCQLLNIQIPSDRRRLPLNPFPIQAFHSQRNKSCFRMFQLVQDKSDNKEFRSDRCHDPAFLLALEPCLEQPLIFQKLGWGEEGAMP